MRHQQWTFEVQATWVQLESFQFDKNNAVFGFSARLAKENGWSQAYTERAVYEYKRFLLLAKYTGHPITPSEAVDQVWHLHLVYTRSYWQGLCDEILGRPLHHEPTSGGHDESAKFQVQYQRTLESYRLFFNEEPCPDLWPSVEQAFLPKINRWVDVSRHWTLPKPSWLPLLRFQHAVAVALALGISFLLVSCEDVSLFDYRGVEFLQFYILGFFVTWPASWLLVGLMRGRATFASASLKLNDPYEIAFLGGGGHRMIDAALTALHTRSKLKFTSHKDNLTRLHASDDKNVDSLSMIEKAVWNRLPADVPILRRSLEPLTRETQRKLVEKGLLLDEKHLFWLRIATVAPLSILMVLGIVKVFVGIEREKPVILLILCLVISLIVILLRLPHMKRRSPDGEVVWKNLKREIEPPKLAEPNSPHAIDPSMAALSVAMLGTSALSAVGYSRLHYAIHRPGTNSNGCGTGVGCGGGCGSSGGGCGSGGGGGSCSSGGCGGCGGGGD